MIMIWKWTDEEYSARQREGFPGFHSVQIIHSGDGYYWVNIVTTEEWNIRKSAKSRPEPIAMI
jgi:hypothetical protein